MKEAASPAQCVVTTLGLASMSKDTGNQNMEHPPYMHVYIVTNSVPVGML